MKARPSRGEAGGTIIVMRRWIHRRRAASGVALMAILFLAAGCATDSGPGKRLTRYRPEMTNRSPWLWKEGGGVTEIPAPVEAAPTNATPPAVKVGTPPPGMSGPMARVLKRGDKVVIYLRDIPVPDEIKDEVDASGTVNLPLIGIVQVEGRTTSEVEDLIEKAYIDGGFYVKMSAIVTAQEDEFFVRGEVKREGRYPLTRDVSLLQAITTAGGYTDFAKEREIKIIRGDEVFVHDGVRIEERKDKDPLVKPGDIIVVQRKVFL